LQGTEICASDGLYSTKHWCPMPFGVPATAWPESVESQPSGYLQGTQTRSVAGVEEAFATAFVALPTMAGSEALSEKHPASKLAIPRISNKARVLFIATAPMRRDYPFSIGGAIGEAVTSPRCEVEGSEQRGAPSASRSGPALPMICIVRKRNCDGERKLFSVIFTDLRLRVAIARRPHRRSVQEVPGRRRTSFYRKFGHVAKRRHGIIHEIYQCINAYRNGSSRSACSGVPHRRPVVAELSWGTGSNSFDLLKGAWGACTLHLRLRC
jgi:hypothetical protein